MFTKIKRKRLQKFLSSNPDSTSNIQGRKKMLQNLDNNIKTLTYVTRILVTLEKNFIIPLIFANYIRMKLLALIKMKLSLKSIPDEVFQMSLKTYSSIYQSEENYVDTYSCVIVNDELVKNESETIWYYICNLSSLKKYKITIYKTSKVGRNEILISDTMKFNIQNYLNVSDFQSDRYFISKNIFLFIVRSNNRQTGG